MAYALYTASYGAPKANYRVTISETSSGMLATVLSTATGPVLNTAGDAYLDGSGNLSVYIDTARTWSVNVITPTVGVANGGGAGIGSSGGGSGSSDSTAALQTAGNASLASLDTKVPAKGTAAAAAAQPVTIATDDGVQTKLGIVTETAPASDTASSGLNGRLQRVSQRLTSLIAQIPATLGIKTASASLSIAPASDALFSLTPTSVRSAITVTRPANVTAYTAGDVVGGVITFTNAALLSAAYLTVLGASVRYDVAAIPSGMTTFRLYLYDVTPPSALADNAAWDLPSGDRASFQGFIDLGSLEDLGSTLFGQLDGLNRQIKTASTSLFGYLVTSTGWTPAANSETLVVTLRGLSGV